MSGIIVPSSLADLGENPAGPPKKRLLRGEGGRPIGCHYELMHCSASVMADRRTIVVHTPPGVTHGSAIALFYDGRLLMAGARVHTCAGKPFVSALTDLNGAVRMTTGVTFDPPGGVWATVSSPEGSYKAAVRTWTGFPVQSSICVNARGDAGSYYEIAHTAPYTLQRSSTRALPPSEECGHAIQSVFDASRVAYRALEQLLAADPPSFEPAPPVLPASIQTSSAPIVSAAKAEPRSASSELKLVYDVEGMPSRFALMAHGKLPVVVVTAEPEVGGEEAVINTVLFDALHKGAFGATVSSHRDLSCAAMTWRPYAVRFPQFVIGERLGELEFLPTDTPNAVPTPL